MSDDAGHDDKFVFKEQSSEQSAPTLEPDELIPGVLVEQPAGIPVQLSSRGVFYDGKMPDGIISIREMGMREEKILARGPREDVHALKFIVDLSFGCVLSSPVPLEDWVFGDVLDLLFQVRSRSLGSEYIGSFRCPVCRLHYTRTIDIDKDIPRQIPAQDLVEPFEVKLPGCGAVVTTRVFRWGDELATEKYAAQVYRTQGSGPGDELHAFRLSRVIISINGETLDPTTILAFVNNLLYRDSVAIRNKVDSVSPGPSLWVATECPRCGDSRKERFPFSGELFRPGSTVALGIG